ncbi:MAG: peptidylprolyl isomerase [Pseudobdellovibrionaceae bacterium]
MRIFLTFVTCFTLLFVAVLPVQAQSTRSESIAAVVNDKAITRSDVNDRMRLIMTSSGIPDVPEARAKIEPQVLNMLIDEQLKMQEAKRLEIEISQDEINEGFAMLAQQNNLEPEKFREMILGSKLKIETLYDQIRAELGWGQVIASQVRPRIQVTDADIEAEKTRLEDTFGADQYHVAEIFLPVTAATDDANVKATADRLYQQLQKEPQAFPAIARQFSQAAGSEKGGDIGWIQKGQIQPQLETVLGTMAVNQFSAPIRSSTGYHILFLRDKKQLTAETMPSEDDIKQSIGNQRLARQARGYFQDLKADAFIDTRG